MNGNSCSVCDLTKSHYLYSKENGRCDKCVDGYYIDNKECIKCEANLHCSKCSDALNCINCENSYYLYKNTKCIKCD